jgi:glycosyltransferase involved in cell wall biosynthesis
VHLSIIIPAFNEEKLIAGCLAKVRTALAANAAEDWTAEVIVVDNNSSDRTAQLAHETGARVVFEPINQISRARNAGARAAGGDWLLFIDADSWLCPATVAEMLAAIRRGKLAGGGCLVALDGVPGSIVWAVETWNLISRMMKWAAGSFIFCQAVAFREVGGFSTELFAAEEIRFSRDLKRWAKRQALRWIILTGQPHVSSGRKVQLYNRGEILKHVLRGTVLMRWTVRDRKKLDFFYDGRR